MLDRFQEILNELSKNINIPLQPDALNSCSLSVDEKIIIQMEVDSANQLLIASFICTIPPGKARENILSQALKANHQFPRLANWAYFDRTNQLILFRYLPLSTLDGSILSTYLAEFTETAISWKDAIEKGNIPSLEIEKK